MGYTRSLLTAAREVRIETAEMPEDIPDGHVRLKLATASICGTDMHYFRHFSNSGFRLKNPVTLGHEACAYVENPNGHDFAVGQLVAINPVIECGQCEACQNGDINMCPVKLFPGSALSRPQINGFFREYFDFPARCCHAVADGVAPEHLTFAEPLACAMHALNRAGVGPGNEVLFTGCSPMGLLATLGACARGAKVDVVDLKGKAVETALEVGAPKGFVVGNGNMNQIADSYDAVIEASGSPHALNLALGAVRKQGVISVPVDHPAQRGGDQPAFDCAQGSNNCRLDPLHV